MFCSKCGANNSDDVKFCSSCGQPLGAATPQASPADPVYQQPPVQPQQTYQQPQYQQTAPAASPEAADAEENKVMAIIAYFIFFIPLVAAKDSKFARYHANQGLILLIFYVAAGILSAILSAIMISMFMIGIWGIISLIFTLLYLGLAVLGILGIINAAQGKMKPMPVIGSLFKFIK